MSLLRSSRALRLNHSCSLSHSTSSTRLSHPIHSTNARQFSDGMMGDAALFSYSSRFKRSQNSVDPASKLPFKLSDLNQAPPMPKKTRPIYIIGSGGIVQNAHLPAYKLAHFDVIGLCDANKATADKVAHDWKLHIAHKNVSDLVASIKKPTECVFDVAVPASAILSVLQQLPDESSVLIQKPLGENLAEARKIRDLCRDKKLRAAVNFQLRYAPNILAMKDIIQRGAIGDIHSIDFRVNCFMPWHLWSFLEKAPRMEIPYHSIHYIDCMRMFMGDASGVHCFTRKDPSTPNLHSSRSVMAFNYGQNVQASIVTNHAHNFGTKHAESYLKIEGTKGAVKAQLGLHLQYGGSNDYLDFWNADVKDWLSVPLKGSWIPHAFIGPMASMMRWMEDPQCPAPTRVDDAVRTMAVVEAAYTSNASEGTPISKE